MCQVLDIVINDVLPADLGLAEDARAIATHFLYFTVDRGYTFQQGDETLGFL